LIEVGSGHAGSAVKVPNRVGSLAAATAGLIDLRYCQIYSGFYFVLDKLGFTG
jgi:hypothetical protein